MTNDIEQFDDDHEERQAAVAVAPAKFHEVLRLVEHVPGTILDLRDYYPSDGMWSFIFACEGTAGGRMSLIHLCGAAKRFPGWDLYIDDRKRFGAAVHVTGFGESELTSFVRSLRRRFRIKAGQTS